MEVLSAIFTCSKFQKETNLSLLGSSSLCHDAAMASTRCGAKKYFVFFCCTTEHVYRGKVYSLQALPHLRQLLLNPNDSLITVISSVKC